DSELLTALHRLLVEHVNLVGSLAKTIEDGRQDQLQAAIDAVDTNSRALADLIGDVAGPDVRDSFLAAWRAQVGLYVDYAFGAATDDDQKKATALQRLNDARGDIDHALSSTYSGMRPGLLADLLRPQVQQIVAAIDAFAAGDATGAYGAL